MLNFKGMRFPIEMNLVCIRWYVAYPLSYRHLEEMMEERGVSVDHSSINRWAVRFLPHIEKMTRKHKRPVGGRWRMDETYIKVKGVWKYLYRAVDKQGKTVDFLLTAKRDMAAAKRFFDKAMGANGDPDKVATDKSGANKAAIDAIYACRDVPIVVRQVKYLNNIVEQDHRAIKRVTRADAQLQIVPRRPLRARRRRAHAHDPQGPVCNQRNRYDVVRRPILCPGGQGPSCLRRDVPCRKNSAVSSTMRQNQHSWLRLLLFCLSLLSLATVGCRRHVDVLAHGASKHALVGKSRAECHVYNCSVRVC
jgi:putative transposase